MPAKKEKKEPGVAAVHPGFAAVVQAFARDEHVCIGGGKGFGAGALQVGGRIFAMMSSQGDFVVKLAKQRVSELVAAGKGKPFDPGHGRPLQEWLVVQTGQDSWVGLAREAYQFVRAGKN